MMKTSAQISKRIKQLAIEQGFTDCGIVPASGLNDDAIRLKTWLEKGMHAGMHYMENHFSKRTDPRKLVPGARSIIVLLLNYFPDKAQIEENNLIISKYAYGRDYHKVMKKKLKHFKDTIHTTIKAFKGRAFVDSAPVLERTLAAAAGLGWIGKNANLISPKHGSFVFIGELITDLELDYDRPLPDYCGGCTKCIEACPTKAIVKNNRTIDSRKCISYWTIEHKGDINEAFRGKFSDRVFGCDICQDVCPWNRKAKPHKEEDFNPVINLIEMVRKDWDQLTEEQFTTLFKGSAVNRTGYEGLIRNIEFASR